MARDRLEIEEWKKTLIPVRYSEIIFELLLNLIDNSINTPFEKTGKRLREILVKFADYDNYTNEVIFNLKPEDYEDFIDMQYNLLNGEILGSEKLTELYQSLGDLKLSESFWDERNLSREKYFEEKERRDYVRSNKGLEEMKNILIQNPKIKRKELAEHFKVKEYLIGELWKPIKIELGIWLKK